MLVPKLTVTEHRIHGCAPWLIRTLLLYSFNRCVTVDRGHRVTIETRHLWFWRRSRIVSCDRIVKVLFRAQRMPGIGVSLSDDDSDGPETAVFFIDLALKAPREEVRLFTVWQRQPREPDFLDRLAGVNSAEPRLGDEEGVRLVTLLRQYLGVPIGRR